MDVKDIILAASIAKGAGGGSGGGVTKEYVDTQVGAVSERVGDIEDVIPSTATPQNPLATTADVSGTAIHSTSTTSPLTDSADGMVQGLTVYGKSEVVDGTIKSAGEGWVTVDLGTLNWERQETQQSGIYRFKGTTLSPLCIYNDETIQGVCARYQADTLNNLYYGQADNLRLGVSNNRVYIRDDNYIDATAFKNSLNGVILAYQLADPTQGNCIAVKTDDGSGIDGTMATFSTGTPLRGIPDTTVRDVMAWDGSSGEVTKNCAEIDLGTRTWAYSEQRTAFNTPLPGALSTLNSKCLTSSTIYTFGGVISSISELPTKPDKTLWLQYNSYSIFIKDSNYTDPTAFKATMSGVMLVYELAEPVTTPLTDAEISAFRGLRTFGSTTNITISDEPEFKFDYLKNTDNGQAVSNIQKDLQGQIDEVKNAAVMGSTIVVVTNEPTLYGRPVTVTAGTKTFTGTFDSSGECTFSNLAIYGAAQVESTDGDGNSAKGSTNITYFGTYVVGISFNVATINLTCSDVSFAGVPVSIYHNGEVVAETSLRLNGQGVLEGTVYVENTGRYTAVASSAGNTVFTSVAVISLKQTYTGTLAASYLPNSDIEHIICEAYGDNFVDGALTWGNGQTPVAFNLNGGSVAPTLQEDNSVYIPVATNNIFASVDLGAPATPFTAYVVMKLRNPGTDSRMIGAMNSRSSGRGILLYSSTIQISSWSNETSTGISSAQFVVCAIQFVGTNLGRGFVRGYGYAEKPSATAGQYVTLARPDINPSTGNASPGDGYFKYVAVINEAESIETVQANIEHLNSVFLGE